MTAPAASPADKSTDVAVDYGPPLRRERGRVALVGRQLARAEVVIVRAERRQVASGYDARVPGGR
jgi:hypothetical protein